MLLYSCHTVVEVRLELRLSLTRNSQNWSFSCLWTINKLAYLQIYIGCIHVLTNKINIFYFYWKKCIYIMINMVILNGVWHDVLHITVYFLPIFNLLIDHTWENRQGVICKVHHIYMLLPFSCTQVALLYLCPKIKVTGFNP